MRKNPIIKLFVIVLIGGITSCESPTSALAKNEQSPRASKSSLLADQLFNEVNNYRISLGKKPLVRHSGLDRLAQMHCDYLVKNSGTSSKNGSKINHMGLEGRALTAKRSYNIAGLGENVISSSDHSAKNFVRQWANSKNHGYNMRSDWYCTGVATATTADGHVIATQLFGTVPGGGGGDRRGNHW